jgi:hypothetical protein
MPIFGMIIKTFQAVDLVRPPIHSVNDRPIRKQWGHPLKGMSRRKNGGQALQKYDEHSK